ncbi:MAG: CHAT domain-containing protein, partial [Deltaproteobacteria bacterium]|nr:CHAT domain-containing protein [Deltaproteobacteria bacterium]
TQGVIAATTCSSFDWSELTHEAAHVLKSRPTEARGGDAERLMVEAAARAMVSGDTRSASILLRLRFLHPEAAFDESLPLLAVVSLSHFTLVHHVDGSVSLHPLGRPDLAALATQAREEMQAGLPGRLLSRLEGLLLPLGPPEGPFLFGSDGSLAEIPLRAIVGLALPDGRPLVPCLVIIDPLGALPMRADRKRHRAIASFADASGDLPGAAREVLRREATRWFRGQASTIEHLRNLGPVGLLHLGLRTIRDRGFPEIQFADGLLSAPEVAGLGLEGNPVVLLTGCATAGGTACLGAERSMASAFLAAGASTVITTRWPVLDAEMRHFVRALVLRWPFSDAAAVVAEVASSLKDSGFAPRLWAAPVVYARSPDAGLGSATCHQEGTRRHPSGAERAHSASSTRERSPSWDGMAGPG